MTDGVFHSLAHSGSHIDLKPFPSARRLTSILTPTPEESLAPWTAVRGYCRVVSKLGLD